MAARGLSASVGRGHRSFLHLRFGSFRFYVVLALVIITPHWLDSVFVRIPLVLPQPEKEVAREFKTKGLEM
jgi:hypothetical protein